MLQTENDSYVEMMKTLVYYLVYKLGGEVFINFDDVTKFVNENVCMVTDIPEGIGFRTKSKDEYYNETN